MEASPVRRPYLWKTDELEFKKGSAKTTQRINQNRHLTDTQRQTNRHLHVKHQEQTPQISSAKRPGMAAYSYRCPMCASRRMPEFTREISTGGWLTFAILLTFCFPLFWIGLMIKEDVKRCPDCNFRLE